MKIPKTIALTALVALIGCSEREAGTPTGESAASPQAPQAAAERPTNAAGEPMTAPDAGNGDAQSHAATGTITAIDSDAGKVTVSHGPVATLEWPAMTMSFQVQDPATVEGLQVGDAVEFSFVPGQGTQYVITRIGKQ